MLQQAPIAVDRLRAALHGQQPGGAHEDGLQGAGMGNIAAAGQCLGEAAGDAAAEGFERPGILPIAEGAQDRQVQRLIRAMRGDIAFHHPGLLGVSAPALMFDRLHDRTAGRRVEGMRSVAGQCLGRRRRGWVDWSRCHGEHVS